MYIILFEPKKTSDLFYFIFDNKIMLLWRKIRILTFLHLWGRGGKSSTVTTRHVTASQNWVQNKPKVLLWHSHANNQ